MPLTGTLRSWNDDCGFGFIAPAHGGRELFVHISAFPRDGSRPIVGESLRFEIGLGKDGKPQAVRVYRESPGRPSTYRRTRADARHRRSSFAVLIVFVLLVVVGAYIYNAFQRQETPDAREVQAIPNSDYRCDGRTRCSEMTSCSEATYFLKNCPGVEMDGDNDGVPCEQQWCSTSRAK